MALNNLSMFCGYAKGNIFSKQLASMWNSDIIVPLSMWFTVMTLINTKTRGKNNPPLLLNLR
jgi:hypothetical protein